MRLLVGLRLLQAVVRVGEISAAVLKVVVEEEAIEIVADVVMMGDVLARAPRLIALPEVFLQPVLALADGLAASAAGFPGIGAGDHLHEVEDVAVLDGEAAV